MTTKTEERHDDQVLPQDIATDIARFAATLDVDALPPEVADAVKTNITDTLACGLAGSSAPAVDHVVDLVRGWGGTGEASLFVFGDRLPAHHAAWANSAMAHARDYDDTHDAAILHAGVSCVPAALAAAQLRGGVSGAELMAAVAAGLEVMCRLGVAIEVDIVESGFIYSSLLAYFGATAAAGRAFGLNDEEMLNALGIAYSSAAGNHQVTRDASLMKRLQPGLAAQAAVVAVQMAKRGIRGAQHIFQGEDGFFRVYLQGRVDADVVVDGLGDRFELSNLSYKPYPCCRDTHAAIDAALLLRTEHPRPASDIESITVGVTAPGYQMVCVPEQVRAAPRTIVEAQFSLPYAVASAWVDGAVGLRHFTDEGLARTDILDLAPRVRPYVDAELQRKWSREVTPARLAVTFRDGVTVEASVDHALGHPSNMLSSDAIQAKLADCARFAATSLRADAASRLATGIGDLETLDDVDQILDLVT